MSTLAECEAAAAALPAEQQQELLLFLATRLRAGNGRLPQPREFGADEIKDWITEDEAGLRHLLAGP